DRMDVGETGVTGEGPRSVQAQVDVHVPHHRRVDVDILGGREGQEQVLAHRLGAQQHETVDLRGLGEAALGAGGADPVAGQAAGEGGGQPVDGMPLRHYGAEEAAGSTQSPVSSYWETRSMRR